MVQKMLDLSTSHLPSAAPDWGTLTVVEHAFGWIVFVPGDPDDPDDWSGPGTDQEEATAWLKPIIRVAQHHGCILINFDRIATTFDTSELEQLADPEGLPSGFKVYNW
jgi:hypothetical protein